MDKPSRTLSILSIKWAISPHGQIRVTMPPSNTATALMVSISSPRASGDYTNYPYGPNAVTGSNWKRSYKQTYEYDAFFNMSRKTSSDSRSPMSTSFSSLLNYELALRIQPGEAPSGSPHRGEVLRLRHQRQPD